MGGTLAMKYPGILSEPEAGQIDDYNEKRVQPRFALMLRSAKLVGPSGEFLCIVRDVSESGAKLKTFHPVINDEPLALEIATGERFGIEKVWERDGEAGVRFLDSVDIMRFIAEAGPFPKRPVRIRVNHDVTLAFAGTTAPATVCDLSRQGARIETPQHLAIGQTIRISGDHLPEFEATVCWRKHPAYGLVFRQLMSMDELAQRVYRMQLQGPAAA